jgi:hypothetical protein
MTNNVPLGPSTLGAVTTATGVSAVGAEAGRDITSGANNSLFGYAAGRALTSGTRNVAVGAGALLSSTAATDTIAIGEFAMANAVSNGARNVAIGNVALGAHTGNDATAIGHYALPIATGANNVAIGSYAGRATTTGTDNIFIGYNSGGIDTGQLATASNTIVVGSCVGATRSGQVVIGCSEQDEVLLFGSRFALSQQNLGNFFLGAASGNLTVTGGSNLGVGPDSLANLVEGNSNLAIGTGAGGSVTDGERNIFVGHEAGGAGSSQDATASDTIVIGYGAGALASGQIVLGTAAQTELTLFGNPWARQYAFADTIIGQGAGNTSPNGGGRVIIGYDAGVGMNTENDESAVVIGYVAGNMAERFRFSVAIGDRAAQFAFNCIDCTIVGSQAGRNLGLLEPAEYDIPSDEAHILAAGEDVSHDGTPPEPGLVGATFVGKNAGRYNTIGTTNTGFGDSALGFTTVGGGNVAVGYVCGEGNVTGSRNSWVGQGIRQQMYSGDDNTQMGYGIGTNLGSLGDWRAGGDRNANMGAEAVFVWAGSDTASIGYHTFFNMEDGAGGDVGVGSRAGEAIITGGQNIFIGQDAGQGETQATNVQNSIAIGAATVTTANNQIVIGNEDHDEITLCGVTFTKVQLEALLALVP